MENNRKTGALVISLDFELHWGLRDFEPPDGNYRRNMLGGREAIAPLLEIFAEYEIAATWATVGFLFARSKADLEKYQPDVLPVYYKKILYPYDEPVGEDEAADALHFAPSLIERIQKTPRQEISTHTYSHYYCLDSGQNGASFAADLKSAIAIAAGYGIKLSSIVFPRNQHNRDYESILREHQICCYRGNQTSWMYQVPENHNRKNPLYRAARIADAYFNLSGANTFKWEDVWENGIANVPASFFLRPYSGKSRRMERLRLKRLTDSVEYAAKNGEIIHLWWHPHNFGVNLTENIGFLREILKTYRKCREKYGMESLSMTETAEKAAANNRIDGK